MSGDLRGDGELDAFEVEGIQAFNRMADAMSGLERRMGSLDAGLAVKLAAAQQIAARAETASEGARKAVKRLEALLPQQTRLAASWAVLGALAGILAAGAGAYWLGHASGREGGFADGYRAALSQNAAAAWGNTPAGKLALALDQAGDLRALAECARPGWVAETKQGRRACFVRPDAKGTLYGWALP